MTLTMQCELRSGGSRTSPNMRTCATLTLSTTLIGTGILFQALLQQLTHGYALPPCKDTSPILNMGKRRVLDCVDQFRAAKQGNRPVTGFTDRRDCIREILDRRIFQDYSRRYHIAFINVASFRTEYRTCAVLINTVQPFFTTSLVSRSGAGLFLSRQSSPSQG